MDDNNTVAPADEEKKDMGVEMPENESEMTETEEQKKAREEKEAGM